MPTHYVSVTDAAAMTSRLRTNKESVLDSANRNSGIIPICETFARSAFDAILADSNCAKVRIYMAMDSNLKLRFVIVGVNSSDEDIFLTDNTSETPVSCVIEAGARCPDICPPDSSLNS